MKKALVIVAHPDDETIWSGGLILENPNWEWTIFSLCRAGDSDRAPKFRKACDEYNALSVIADLDDESDEPLSTFGIKEMIKQNLQETDFDFIFTHGKNGEYGHVRHVGVHEAVTELVKEKYLKCEKLWYFDYIAGERTAPHNSKLKIPIANPKADLLLRLTDKEHQKKLKLLTDIYGFKHPLFETMAAGKEEAFTLGK